MRRRDFLQRTGLASLVLAVPAVYAQAAGSIGNVLVLVEVARGGNDGLNTVVRIGMKSYYRLATTARCAVECPEPAEQLGFNPVRAAPCHSGRRANWPLSWSRLALTHNRSHFRSIEIWDTASNSAEVLQEGWIARLFAKQNHPPPSPLTALPLVWIPGPLSVRIADHHDASSRNSSSTVPVGSNPPIRTRTTNPAPAHILTVQNELSHAATLLQDKLAWWTRTRILPFLPPHWPAAPGGRQLLTDRAHARASAQSLAWELDTIATKRNTHDRLLHELAEHWWRFRRSHANGSTCGSRWCSMTYAEFGGGRRKTVALPGTDHGTAAPHSPGWQGARRTTASSRL
jgi:uncharacterized protein (DUF1501 family)